MIDVEGSVAELRALWRDDPAMHKTWTDIARYERIIGRLEPAVIVETGLLHGASHCWFAKRAPLVVTVEINPDEIALFTDRPANGVVIEGDSTDPATVAQVEALVEGGPVLVVLDSDHGTDTVYGEMCAYGPLVTPGSYMVVEDGVLAHVPPGPFLVGNWFDGHPGLAIERYLADHDGWVNDDDLEGLYPTTQHPGGWLRRA